MKELAPEKKETLKQKPIVTLLAVEKIVQNVKEVDMYTVLILAIIGFVVSLYGFYIEEKLKKNPEYKPICDISDAASCTKPMKSSFGRIFGIRNTIIGMIFYAGIAVLTYLGYHQLALFTVVGACVVSVYLAYILYFKIKTICLICTVTYVVNAGLLVTSWFHL